MQIGQPLDDATFKALPKGHQTILRAFFAEADIHIEICGSNEDNPLPATESLQLKYDVLVRLGYDVYCPVKQRARLISFVSPISPTVH